VTGATGPAGPTLFKRATFTFATIPAVGQTPGQLATITFTPPNDGTAILRGRGYCNLDPIVGQDNEVDIAAGTALAAAFNTPVTDWGVMRIVNGSTAGTHQVGWTAESTLAVKAGVATQVFLAGHHGSGATTSNCSGSFSVEVYTGTLP
jgi:hypothetical protein